MIEVRHISKSYDKTDALSDISFEVPKGEIFGLIGPDGAGKTTLFRILTTLQLPDGGTARIGKWSLHDHRQIRSNIGYMPGRFSLYQDLSVQENLEFFAAVFGTTVEENYDLIRDIYAQIAPFKNRRAGALSGGMKQKLALSCALIHRPEVLLLDEPTTGVDPVSRKEFWDILNTLKASNITILVSTPFMDEAALCDRIALINKGRILAVDTPDGIRRGFDKILFAVRTGQDMFTLLKDLNVYTHTGSAYAFGEYVHYTGKQENVDVARELTGYLSDRGHRDIEIREIHASVEDAFIEQMHNQ